MKKVKFVFIFIILVTGLAIGIYQPNLFGYFIYWWVLVLIVLVGLSYHLKSRSYLSVSFAMFFLSALFTVIGLKETAETIMRLSFIGWIVGWFHAILEYKNSRWES